MGAIAVLTPHWLITARCRARAAQPQNLVLGYPLTVPEQNIDGDEPHWGAYASRMSSSMMAIVSMRERRSQTSRTGPMKMSHISRQPSL